jgi:hypothetical protein
MEWFWLLVILLIVVIIFAIWRRTRDASSSQQVAPIGSERSDIPPAAEGSGDEVLAAPADEQPPVLDVNDRGDSRPVEDWWHDAERHDGDESPAESDSADGGDSPGTGLGDAKSGPDR